MTLSNSQHSAPIPTFDVDLAGPSARAPSAAGADSEAYIAVTVFLPVR